MATANFYSSAYVDTWNCGSTSITSSQNGYMGYSNASGTHRFVTAYSAISPAFTGTSSSVTITVGIKNVDSSAFSSKTWKCGISAGAAESYQNAYYSTSGYYTASTTGSVSGSGTATLTFTISGTDFSPGLTYYFYFYSGAAQYNTVKITSFSAILNYTSETVTGTSLTVGLTSSAGSTYVYPTPGSRTVYWKVSGLGYQVKQYTKFYLYLSSGFSFTQGQTSAPTGTLITTYSSSSSTAYEFTQSFTVPTTTFLIGQSTGIVCVTQNASGYWRIGGSSNTPKTCYVHPKAQSWFQEAVSVTPRVTGKNSVTYTVTHKTKNNPQYLHWVGTTTSSVSTSGANSYSGLEIATTNSASYGGKLPTTSAAATYTMPKSGLSAGTTYTRYLIAGAKYSTPYYTYNTYYGLGSITFTTDADYSGTNTSTVTGSTSATITSTVNSTINIDGNIYYSTSSGLTSKPSTYKTYDDNNKITISLTGLSSNKSYTYYFYVYSAASGILYSIGSTTFTTDAASYSVEVSGVSTTSTDADIYITSISPTTNLIANRVYLSSVPSSDSYYFYYNCTNHGLLMSYSENGNPLVYEAILPTSDVKYLQFESLKAPNEEIRMYPDNSNDVVSAGDFQIYDDIPDDAEIGEWQLSFATAFGEDPSHIDFEQYYVSPGNGSVNLELEPAHEYTKYIYVKSSASNQYYLGGIIVFKTDSYFYHCEDTSALTPCWAFMYNESEESWERVLPDFSNL